MASVCGLMFCSSWFAKEVLNNFQLTFVQHALIVLVADGQKCIIQASGLAEFLAEGLEGGFVVLAFASRFVKTTLYKANKNEIHKQKEYFV